MKIRQDIFRRATRHMRTLSVESLENRVYLSGTSVSTPALSDVVTPDTSRIPSEIIPFITSSVTDQSIDVHVTPGEFTRAVEAINQFAFDLYNHFQREQGNLFLSPMSISTALAMTYAGANGETAARMAEVMHLGDNPGIHASFRALLETLNAEGATGKFSLDLANALWPQKDFPFRDDYLQLVKEQYGGGLQNLDYIGNAEAARQTINAWVEEKTHEKIKDLIPSGALNDMTRLVLTNAIYFKGQWATKFDPALTSDRPFYYESGESAQVPTMYLQSNFHYTELDGYQVLDLPYKDDDLSMVILLPKSKSSSSYLGYDTIQKLDDWLDSPSGMRDVILRLPKFKMTVSSGLGDLLSGMGMSNAFDKTQADFTSMAHLYPDERLYIDKVLHKAFVEVNEEGTEAAAATAVIVSLTGCFAAGTPVCTPGGWKRIEDIKPGDLVLSRNEFDHDGPVVPKRVEECFARTATTLNLHVAGQVVHVTAEHPFYVQKRGWVAAGELQVGDLLATDDCAWRKVEKIVITGDHQPVYNFRVAHFHTYFLGGDSWGFKLWVHNFSCGGEPPPPIVFTADHAFHFLIRDNHTGATLFLGRVTDPAQTDNDLQPTYHADNIIAQPSQPDDWSVTPHATGTTSISMTAATPAGIEGVEYYFHCLTPGGHDSGWQTSPTYVDTGLFADTSYAYQVKTRSQVTASDEGDYSIAASATTLRNPFVSVDIPVLLNFHTITGTLGNDMFEFHAGGSPSDWTLLINGVKQTIPANAIQISINGISGDDQLLFYGSTGALKADLGYENGTFEFGNNTITYSNMDSVHVTGATGNDMATLHDSAAADAFQGLPGLAQLTAGGKAIAVKNFKSVNIQASTGNDSAVMYDNPAGNSNYIAGATGVKFAGAGFNYTTAGFTSVSAYAARGKNNSATFNSTDGNDLLIASWLGAQYVGPGFAYDVWNVPNIRGVGGAGDEARFYGSPNGNTTLNLTPTTAIQSESNLSLQGSGYSKFASYVYPSGNTSATITGTSAAERVVTSPMGIQMFAPNLSLSAWTYRHMTVVGGGGADTADMYASNGADSFSSIGPVAKLTSGGVDRTINNFSKVTANGNTAAVATFIAKTGQTNTFSASPTQASMSGNGYQNVAIGFGSNTGLGVVGGSDVVNYTDSAGNDFFISSYLGTQMFGQSFNNSAWNFATTNATSAGGSDTARFYGSPTKANSFVASPTQANHAGQGFNSTAKNFARVEAYAGLSIGSSAVLTGSTANDTLVASPAGAQMWGSGYRIEAWNYRSLKTEGNGGNDIANLYGKPTNNKLAADNLFAEFSGDAFDNRVEHFPTVRIFGSTTGSDTAVLDHAYLETGAKDLPAVSEMFPSNRKLWLYDFDQIATTKKPGDATSRLQTVNKVMTAFLFE